MTLLAMRIQEDISVYIAVCGMGTGRGDQSARKNLFSSRIINEISSCHDVNKSARAMLGYQRLIPGTMARIGIEICEKFDNYPLLSQSWRL
jgi:hypothetical protein